MYASETNEIIKISNSYVKFTPTWLLWRQLKRSIALKVIEEQNNLMQLSYISGNIISVLIQVMHRSE